MSSDRRTSKPETLKLLQTGDPEDFDAAALIRWTLDEHHEVRDWATFVLGSQTDLDGDEVRKALRDRLNDSDLDTRCEAFVGLARRRDEAGVGAVLRALEGETVSTMMVEAAGRYGREAFLPALLQLRDWWDVDEQLLENAIAHCSGDVRDEWWVDDQVSNG